jgi:hypothetical protein
VEYGMVTRTGAVGKGDGNGLLEACSAGAIVGGCENVLFWRDLNTMNMLEGWFQTATDALGPATTTTQDVALVYPETKIGRGNYWTAFAAQGKNWYQITGITAVSAAGVYTLTGALSPFETFNIDRKMDDGRPITGGARAMYSVAALNVADTPGAAACTVTAAPNTVYNQTTEALANTPVCQLRLRF